MPGPAPQTHHSRDLYRIAGLQPSQGNAGNGHLDEIRILFVRRALLDARVPKLRGEVKLLQTHSGHIAKRRIEMEHTLAGIQGQTRTLERAKLAIGVFVAQDTSHAGREVGETEVLQEIQAVRLHIEDPIAQPKHLGYPGQTRRIDEQENVGVISDR